jgi:succinate dehydrogenase / fumarate reductase cytochrome b subunit
VSDPSALRDPNRTLAPSAVDALPTAKAVPRAAALRRGATLFGSTVGQKIVVAITGLILLAFVFGHMAGNLKVFEGAELFDSYARFLREAGSPLVPHAGLLWAVRLVLFTALVLHVVCIARLSAASRRARDVSYHQAKDLSLSFASRFMLWGGVILLVFVVYHLMHLTLGVVHPAFVEGAVYHNVVTAFQVPWVATIYLVALLALALHVYHGLWSTTQTLAIQSPFVRRWRRPASAVLAAGLLIGYLLVPAAVVLRWLRLP